MNRLSPLIVRTVGPHAPAGRLDAPRERRDAQARYEDLKLFATGWVGGLVFFGTMLA